MKTVILTGSLLLLGFASCTSENMTEGEKALENELKETIESSIITAEEFKGKLDELLTLPMAAEVSELPSASAKKDYTKMTTFESLSYEWKSDRMKTVQINTTKMEVPVTNAIQLSWVKNTTLEQFKHDYHNLTEEEVKKAGKEMTRQMDKMESKGEVTKQQGDAALKEAKIATSSFNVEEVPNVGEYAVFVNSNLMGAASRDLKVFYKGLSFTLNVNLSDDATVNDQKCVETAKKIINEKLK